MNKRDVLLLVALGTLCVTFEGLAVIWYGLRCAALMMLAMVVCVALCMALRDLEEIDDPPIEEEKSCVGCVRYLGGGMCRSSLEAECCEGGGYEMYEAE